MKPQDKDSATIDFAILYFSSFKSYCEANNGRVYITDFFITQEIGGPYKRIFQYLRNNKFFENIGNKMNPIYTNFKPVEKADILLAINKQKKENRTSNSTERSKTGEFKFPTVEDYKNMYPLDRMKLNEVPPLAKEDIPVLVPPHQSILPKVRKRTPKVKPEIYTFKIFGLTIFKKTITR